MASSYPQWLAREERKADRHLLTVESVAGSARTPPQSVELVDLSPLGCRLRLGTPVPVGTYIKLSGTASPLEGWVAWSRGTECGIDFAQPLAAPVIEHLFGSPQGGNAREYGGR